MSKTVLFHTIQFSMTTQFSSFLPIDRSLSGATTQVKNGHGGGGDGKERVLRISQSSSITWASSFDYLVSYLGNTLGKSYPSTEMQSVYSTTQADWIRLTLVWLPI